MAYTNKEIIRREFQKGVIGNCIDQFSLAMKDELEKHLDRPRWKDESLWYLIGRLLGETGELLTAIEGKKSRKDVIKEAVDVANFAMMIADVYRQRVLKAKIVTE